MLTLYRFDSIDTAGRWTIVDDGVMGGVSKSDLALSGGGTLLFTGTVSLENNGGFASARSATEDYGITDEEGIRMSVRGDGKLYRFRLYAADRASVAYEAPFRTIADEWQAVDLPFSMFEPTVRGQVMKDYGPIDPASIEAVGVMVKDNQVGEFALEIESIKAYR